MSEPSGRTRLLRRWWPIYTVLAMLGFVIPQTIALIAAEPGDGFVAGTYSETWAGWLMTGGVVLSVVLVAFTIWFPLHLRRWWPWERPKDGGG